MSKMIEHLNDLQREAVCWNRGPVLVLAGPGSGKTRVLTTRIIRLLESSAGEAFRILGLTFTTKAAAEMRSRLVDNVAAVEHPRVRLTTFHSFCGDVLRQHGNHIGVMPDFEIISTRIEQHEILDRVLKRTQEGDVPVRFKSGIFRPDIAKLLGVVEGCFETLLTDNEIRQTPKDSEWGGVLAEIVRQYRKELVQRNSYDFGSLLLLVHELFVKQPKVLNLLRKVYRHICIDEFQDTNVAQYRILQMLVAPDPSTLFVVADEDQVIYEWNGASPTRLTELREDFGAQVLQLPTNYRCPPTVIALANRLILQNTNRSRDKRPLEAGKPVSTADSIRSCQFKTFEDELAWVVDDILSREPLQRGRCVVLARTNQHAERAADAINSRGAAAGVLAVVLARKDDFRSAQFRWLCAILKLLAKPSDGRSLETVCKTFHQLESVQIEFQDVVQGAVNSDYFRRFFAEVRSAKGVEPVTISFCEWILGNTRLNEAFSEFLRRALEWLNSSAACDRQIQSGQLEEYKNERKAWNALYKDALSEFGKDELDLRTLTQEISLASKTTPVPDGAVRCMTVHGAKGMEFAHVYLVGMTEGTFPSYKAVKAGDESSEMEEERRNCFVAITRTESTLTLSHSRREGTWNRVPSRFLNEMGLDQSHFFS